MDSAKLKKLQDYAAFLTQQAESKESKGEKGEAVKDYVKLVDVLLLLANDAKDHPSWQELIGKAEYYQRKARSMVDPEKGTPTNPSKPSNPYDVRQAGKFSPTTQEKANPPSSSPSTTSSSHNPFRKFPSLMGKKNEKGPHSSDTIDQAPTSVISTWARDLETKPLNASSSTQQLSVLQATKKAESQFVARTQYEQLLEEKSKLEKEVQELREREEKYQASLQEQEKAFAQKIAEMVPMAEYEELKAQLAESVPRFEYEQLKAVSAVPKESYIELQNQLMDLEIKLQNSVPKMLIDDIADYISFLVSTVPSLSEENPTGIRVSKEQQSQTAISG